MAFNFSWKIGGEAGYGIMTTGLIFARAFSRLGFRAFANNEYPSLIRGGHNTYQIRVSDEEIFSHEEKIDLLAALNPETIDFHKGELRGPDSGIIYDNSSEEGPAPSAPAIGKLYGVPLSKIAGEEEGKIMMNTVALGASMALLGSGLDGLDSAIRSAYWGKDEKMVNANLAAAKSGHDYVREKYGSSSVIGKIPAVNAEKKRMLVSGNEAVCLGAIAAGCRFLSAYPMTPTSGVIHFMAAHERELGLVVKQTEDEIAAINMAIGASFAGVRAMTATSGGGFSLMAEAYGEAGMTETPVVIIEGQRPGPSTGLPTRTEQGDLKFVLSASQGDFPRIVVAPGDAEEAFYLTADAFNLAEKFQCPAVVLMDKYLCESLRAFEFFDESKIRVDRGLLLNAGDIPPGFRRFAFTESGISPRSVPGQRGGIFCASTDEHYENGFLMEEEDTRTRMMDKRERKLEAAEKYLSGKQVKTYGNPGSDKTIISWGSTKGPILEAVKLLERDGVVARFLQVVCMSPFPSKEVTEIIKGSKSVIVVEQNKTGQLASLIREKTGILIDNKILKYSGRPFCPEEICREVRKRW